jgi:arylsulfatase A-like enzyme
MVLPMPLMPKEPPARSIPLRPLPALALAVGCGLVAGYLDLAIMLLKQAFWYDERFVWSGRDYPWSVPLVHAGLMLVPGMIVALANLLRPGSISLRVGAWLFAAIALWMAWLRAPIHGGAALILALGLGRPISRALVAGAPRRRWAWSALAVLLVVLGVLAAGTTGRQAWQEARGVAQLPAPPPAARNVVLIVWDTVRAQNLSLYGYGRDTTPNLARWAREGILFNLALAPAPWTFPSHSSIFTGRWPYQLDSQWNYTLQSADPTLASVLSAHGYQTAGFSANTNCCSWESGLDRGFLHYEDYPLAPGDVLGRTVAGSWIRENLVGPATAYTHKWVRLQSRDARGINDAFLHWLSQRRPDRPYFAFLNYFDAHQPYIPEPEYVGRFGRRPQPPWDDQLLLDLWPPPDPRLLRPRDHELVRDCYDDCLAFLDKQLGRLLLELRRQGQLENTLVIVTSDHGEAFGEHGIFGHSTSVYLDQVAVPLVMLGPGVPPGRAVSEAVSLRDLPATVLDVLGLADGAPLPGRSLAALWRPGSTPAAISPALSEIVHATPFLPQRGLRRGRMAMSLVTRDRHYIRHAGGVEELYDVRTDPFDARNLAGRADGKPALELFRRSLLTTLSREPATADVELAYMKTYRQSLASELPSSAEAGSRLSRVDREDALDLGEGLGVVLAEEVAGRDDRLRLSPGQVGAGVRDDAVAAVGQRARSELTGDRVRRNPGAHGKPLHGQEQRVLPLEVIDRRGQPIAAELGEEARAVARQ